jgi:biopolymer transport protein ExbD
MNTNTLNILKARKRRFWNFTRMMLVSLMSTALICTAQTMQSGISVELAPTSSAVAVPDADSQNALIVTVTDTGRLYFGITPVTPDLLAEELKGHLFQHGRNLYIKADARAPYAYVVKVLDVAHNADISTVTLLTTQQKAKQAGTVSLPQGIEMQMARSSTAARK